MKNTHAGLRLVAPNTTDENLAVDQAQFHARNRSLSWKQYVKNLELSLCLELDFEGTVGDFR